MTDAPVGISDSGVGGPAVARAILAHDACERSRIPAGKVIRPVGRRAAAVTRNGQVGVAGAEVPGSNLDRAPVTVLPGVTAIGAGG